MKRTTKCLIGPRRCGNQAHTISLTLSAQCTNVGKSGWVPTTTTTHITKLCLSKAHTWRLS